MSHAFGLVKFKTTGNIYYCCYDGTSDIMVPFLCTPEECYNKDYDLYDPIEYCQKLSKGKSWYLPDNISDLDAIEIYSDYGGGFYWAGTGSESAKMIENYLNPFNDVSWFDIHDGSPEWVKEFLERLEVT